MLDSIEPSILDEWIAYWRIEPDVGERLRQLTETIKHGISAICAAQGFEVNPELFDFAAKDEDSQQASEPEMSPAQGAAMVATHLGAADKRQ